MAGYGVSGTGSCTSAAQPVGSSGTAVIISPFYFEAQLEMGD
jgi:hypothetical protein